jgi:hypothetical protein
MEHHQSQPHRPIQFQASDTLRVCYNCSYLLLLLSRPPQHAEASTTPLPPATAACTPPAAAALAPQAASRDPEAPVLNPCMRGLPQAASFALRLQQGKDVTCGIEHDSKTAIYLRPLAMEATFLSFCFSGWFQLLQACPDTASSSRYRSYMFRLLDVTGFRTTPALICFTLPNVSRYKHPLRLA